MRIPSNPNSEVPLSGLEAYYQEFRQTRIDEIALMNKALLEANFQVLAKLAHQWKGFAAPYGFGILGDIALELELKANQKEQGPCSQLLLEAQDYLLIQKKRDDF